jgi:hypothetical protein
LPAGEYEVRIYIDGGYDVRARSSFNVEKGQDSVQEQTELYIKTHKPMYAVGEAIVVEYGGLPGNDQDWITVVTKGTAEDSYQDHWFYTEGRKKGNYAIEGLPAGEYEARVYFNGGYEVQKRFAFKVGN